MIPNGYYQQQHPPSSSTLFRPGMVLGTPSMMATMPLQPVVVNSPVYLYHSKISLGALAGPGVGHPGYSLKNRILGNQGQNLKYIMTSTGAKVELKGKGVTNDNEPLHLVVSAPTESSLKHATELSEHLIETVRKEYAELVTKPLQTQQGMVSNSMQSQVTNRTFQGTSSYNDLNKGNSVIAEQPTKNIVPYFYPETDYIAKSKPSTSTTESGLNPTDMNKVPPTTESVTTTNVSTGYSVHVNPTTNSVCLTDRNSDHHSGKSKEYGFIDKQRNISSRDSTNQYSSRSSSSNSNTERDRDGQKNAGSNNRSESTSSGNKRRRGFQENSAFVTSDIPIPVAKMIKTSYTDDSIQGMYL